MTPAATDPLSSPPAARILVVDDDAAVCRVVQRILTASGYDVVTATTAAQAMEPCVSGEGFDLLLTDLVMPDLDGESLADRLRTVQRGLAVLFMSGYVQGPDLTYGDGATLGKPFTSRALLRGVAETLAGRPPRTSVQ